jgi:medium-chain acyl-[acyl-carrier-protein] hydrolase
MGLTVLPVHLPGRDARMSDPPPRSLDALVDELGSVLVDAGLGEAALLGHSFGALIAFEVARALASHGADPRLLVVAAHRAPHLPPHRRPLADLDDEALIGAMEAARGAPFAGAERELAELMVETFRADCRLQETYQYRPGPPLTTPLLILTGLDDELVPADRQYPWRAHTIATSAVWTIAGDHQFLFRSDVTARVLDLLVRAVSRPWQLQSGHHRLAGGTHD